MAGLGRMITAAVAGVAFSMGSIASAAAPLPSASPTTQAAQNPWATLSLLSPVGAAALTGSAAAAQPLPPPPGQYPANQYPPNTYQYNGGVVAPPPVALLAVWAALLVAFIALVSQNHNHPVPNSPA